jgi:5-methylcytosine-specific restriction protein A
MPDKPLRPCNYPGCKNIIRDGRYCDEHESKAQQDYNRYRRSPDTNETYGYEWRTRIRPAFLSQHPLCEICLKKGIYTPATEVHHKIPVADGGTNAFDNLQALCKLCHSGITSKTNQ